MRTFDVIPLFKLHSAQVKLSWGFQKSRFLAFIFIHLQIPESDDEFFLIPVFVNLMLNPSGPQSCLDCIGQT